MDTQTNVPRNDTAPTETPAPLDEHAVHQLEVLADALTTDLRDSLLQELAARGLASDDALRTIGSALATTAVWLSVKHPDVGELPDLPAEQRLVLVTALRAQAADALRDMTARFALEQHERGRLRMLDARLPSSVGEAVQVLADDEDAYLRATQRVAGCNATWARLDVQTGRVRAGCTEEGTKGGLSPTAADKAASAHPRYTAHKDATAEARAALDDAISQQNVALARMLNARAFLTALTVEQYPAANLRVSTHAYGGRD